MSILGGPRSPPLGRLALQLAHHRSLPSRNVLEDQLSGFRTHKANCVMPDATPSQRPSMANLASPSCICSRHTTCHQNRCCGACHAISRPQGSRRLAPRPLAQETLAELWGCAWPCMSRSSAPLIRSRLFSVAKPSHAREPPMPILAHTCMCSAKICTLLQQTPTV